MKQPKFQTRPNFMCLTQQNMSLIQPPPRNRVYTQTEQVTVYSENKTIDSVRP